MIIIVISVIVVIIIINIIIISSSNIIVVVVVIIMLLLLLLLLNYYRSPVPAQVQFVLSSLCVSCRWYHAHLMLVELGQNLMRSDNSD